MYTPHFARTVWVLAAGWLVACGDAADRREVPLEPVPQADRQSWNSTLHLQGPESTITVTLPFSQDFDERQLTLGEGGVVIEFVKENADSAGAQRIEIRAERLALEHADDRMALAGSVAVVTADSVLLTTDSLRWSRTDDLLEVPGWADVTRSNGSLRARDLSANTSLERWSARNVTGLLRATDDKGVPYELQVRAKRDSSIRPAGGYLSAAYETASVRIGGRSVGSDLAVLDEENEQIFFSGGVVLVDSARTISADWLEHNLALGTSSASGSVVVDERDWRLQAKAIEVDGSGDRWTSSGTPVLVEWEGRSLSAAHLSYNSHSALAFFTASGNLTGATQIEFRDGERLIIADSLTYHRGMDLIEAFGAVAFTAPEFVGVIQAQKARVALDSETAQLSGSARLIRQRTAASLVIGAHELNFDLAGRQMAGNGDFFVSNGIGLTLKAGHGYFDSKTESLTLSQGVEFTEQAFDTIHSDSMVVTLKDGEVVDVLLPSPLTGSVATSASQTSWVEAGGGLLHFESERVETIVLTGNARVTHRSQRNAINRFTGTKVTMNFRGGQLVTVMAAGEAMVQSRLSDTDDGESAAKPPGNAETDPHSGPVNRVTGNRLQITLEDGIVIEVKASESVEGEFVPASADDPTPTSGD